MKKKILIVFLICCMLLGVASPAFAADSYPDPDPSWSEYDYVIYKMGSNFYAFVYYDIPYVYLKNTTRDSDVLLTINIDSGYYVDGSPVSYSSDAWYSLRCRYDPTSETWVNFNPKSVISKVQSGTYKVYEAGLDTANEYFFTTRPVYVSFDSSDYSVFRVAPPLAELTEELIQMTPEALDLDGKMKILVPFGISCLALLISLPLLLKVLRRFLG